METTPSSSSKGFDQRLNSKLSIERSRLATQRVHDINNDLHHHSKSLPKDVTSIGKGQYKFFQWYKLCKIQEQIDSSYFKAEYGLPSLVCTSDEYIAIATSECYILLFSYTQILVKTIKTNNIEPSVWVESMAVSVDSTFLLGGFVQSSLGRQMLADVYEHDVVIPESYESGSLAAMFLAKMSLGLENKLEDISKYIGSEKRYTPDETVYEKYRKLIPIYIRLSRELSSEYKSIADYQREFANTEKE